MVDNFSEYHQETRFIHSAQPPDPITGAIAMPITLSTIFAQRSPGIFYSIYDYTRSNNPNREAFEKCIASAEDAKYALAFGSLNSAATTLLALFQPSDHIIISTKLCCELRILFKQIIQNSQNIQFSDVDISNLEEIRAAVREETKLIWCETLSEPTMQLADILEISSIAKEKYIKVVVDNTLASPYCASPLSLGADIVIHSVGKYIAGHNDVLMGAIVTNDEWIYQSLIFLQYNMGGTPSPFDCYTSTKGLKTLHLRMKAHSENALAVSQFLSSNSKVQRTLYPGIISHPQHSLALKQMKLFSGIVSFCLKGGLEAAKTFLSSVQLFSLSDSFGGVESLVAHPEQMNHTSETILSKSEGFESLIRLSVGVEHISDLLSDLDQALNKVVIS